MTLEILTYLLAATTIFSSGNKPVDNKHFLIYGKTIELDFDQGGAPIPSEGVEVVIYQDDEIYVAFPSKEQGEYSFNLPIGYEYRVVYGGKDYVNKSIVINSRTLTKSRTGHAVEVEMSVFKPIENADMSALDEPIAIFYCDQQLKEIVPDIDYSMERSKKVKKAMKKALKNK